MIILDDFTCIAIIDMLRQSKMLLDFGADKAVVSRISIIEKKLTTLYAEPIIDKLDEISHP